MTAATGSRLHGKIAAIFGAGGEVGAEVAKEFAGQGAHLFLSGRTTSRVQTVADAIPGNGGTVAVAGLNALDEDAVRSYLDQVVAETGRLDIVFNAVGPQPTKREGRRSLIDETVGSAGSRTLIDNRACP
jgi:NAD(P)-dependent dehydrogenase (short-subunit alcohol dehydrogenase family)